MVATYEGEHNHEASPGSNKSVTPGSATSGSSSGPTITLDLTKPKTNQQEMKSAAKFDAPELQNYFVEQMASTLTKDPSFKAALAAAISGKFLQQNNHVDKW